MIVSPNILAKVKGQSFPAYAPLLGQLPFEVAPESLEPIDVTASPVGVLTLAVIHQSVHIPFCGEPCIAAPAVGAHHRSFSDPLFDTGLEIPGLDPCHNFGPDLPVAAENAEDRLLRGPSAPLGAPSSRGFALVFPLSPDIGLVDFHNATEGGREVGGHRAAERQKEFEEFVLADRAPFKKDIGRVFEVKFGYHPTEERGRHDHPAHARPEGGAAVRTPHFSTPEFPESCIATSSAPEHRFRS